MFFSPVAQKLLRAFDDMVRYIQNTYNVKGFSTNS